MQTTLKKYFTGLLLIATFQFSYAQTIQNKVTASTFISPPVSPYFNRLLTGGNLNVNVYRIPSDNGSYDLYPLGILTRLSAPSFTLELDSNKVLKPFRSLPSSPSQLPLSPTQRVEAFGNLQEQNLRLQGVSWKELTENGEIKLPDGQYMMCFYIRGRSDPFIPFRNFSGRNASCATFTICTKASSAPQFTQPVNNLNINSSISILKPSSPVVFTWTPPQSVCGLPPGGYKYDFEIHEIFNNQSVTDAINNPFVFQKIGLPAPTFLLDTLLYRRVLQIGKRYAIRVRASGASLRDTFSIANNGYSRVEAFQYGTSPEVVATPFPVQKPAFYYIPFGQRKTSQWDNVYTAYQNGRRRDTLVPIREYIALNLIQNGIAYNPDAIELFMALNPELAGLENVELSNRAKLPEFPVLPDAGQRQFEAQHTTSLSPEAREATRFKILLDSIRASGYRQSLPDTAAKHITDLIAELSAYNRRVPLVNRITVNLLNDLLAELLYILVTRQKDDAHLRGVVEEIRELTTTSLTTTSLLLPSRRFKQLPLSVPPALHLSLAGYSLLNEDRRQSDFLPVDAPLLPLSVIVWRKATDPPARAVYNSPDLTGAFRVFFTTPLLYNHKNPEINAKSLPSLASTAQVSLPKLGHFKFWTLNMVAHKWTAAEDVETNDVFLLNNKKKWPNSKKLYVVIKVD